MDSFIYKQNFRYPGEFSEWLDHPEDKDQQALQIQVTTSDGESVGFAFFGYLNEQRGGNLSCLEVFVKEEYRRKKVATRMYDLAEIHYQDSVKPYPGASKDSGLFWKKRSCS